jgi:hypothetical protein
MDIKIVTLPDFILSLSGYETNNQELIISTKHPFWYCQVYKASTTKKLQAAVKKTGLIDFSRSMMFYNIAFVPMGRLSPSKKEEQFPTELLKEMGNFYAVEKTGDEEFESYNFIDKKKRLPIGD